jgi:hypothetical protein
MISVILDSGEDVNVDTQVIVSQSPINKPVLGTFQSKVTSQYRDHASSKVQLSNTQSRKDESSSDTVHGSPSGVAMPKFIELPWLPSVGVRSIKQVEPPQQDQQAMLEMYARQQAMNEMYAKQRAMSELNARRQSMRTTELLLSQLNADLATKRVDNFKEYKAVCDLNKPVDQSETSVLCHSVFFDNLLENEKPVILEVLMSRVRTGQTSAGLNIVVSGGRMSASFH